MRKFVIVVPSVADGAWRMGRGETESAAAAVLKQAIKSWPGTRKELCELAGVPASSLSMFMKGRQGLGTDYFNALYDRVAFDSETGEPYIMREIENSDNQTGQPRRYRVHVVRSTHDVSARGVFMERPAFPTDFDVSEHEAKLIWERRSDDPYRCLAIAAGDLAIGLDQLPETDLAIRSGIQAAIAMLNALDGARTQQPKP
jgi:hypothetical protein